MNKYVDMGDGTTRIYFGGVNPDLFTEIDTEDCLRAKVFTWYPSYITKRNLTQYARALIGGKSILLHRLIMSFPLEGQVDHIDQSGLNNTKNNLRVVSATENSLNKPLYRGKKNDMPKGIGLRRFKTMVGYRARIRVESKLYELGTYRTLEEAVSARSKAEVLVAERRLHELQNIQA